ncbi:hypothetical protein E2566_00655 [Pectobacterium punjabense]|uniref:Uncharacterized protein n=1 Tax=Pectobacterium punjabense TaxID=2108399 RepID=A0ABX6KWQ5_9GAMM|nr:hypothetical protein [Pectobacterium punjabense]MBS4429654.1 hypothetical protein [Pectobacterium punjabense]PTA65050.1 hypothetical protein C9I36_07060 [Pectobacterium punjabense]QJA18563.1 hypothetical protein E2566_00655 [Pectobacterium punjabense]
MLNAMKMAACVLVVLVTAPHSVSADGINVKIIGTLTLTAYHSSPTDGCSSDYSITLPVSLKNGFITLTGLEVFDTRKNSGEYDVRLIPSFYATDGESALLVMHRNTSRSWEHWVVDNDAMCHASDKRQQLTCWKKARKLRSLAKLWLAHRACKTTLIKALRLSFHKPAKLDRMLILELDYL